MLFRFVLSLTPLTPAIVLTHTWPLGLGTFEIPLRNRRGRLRFVVFVYASVCAQYRLFLPNVLVVNPVYHCLRRPRAPDLVFACVCMRLLLQRCLSSRDVACSCLGLFLVSALVLPVVCCPCSAIPHRRFPCSIL